MRGNIVTGIDVGTHRVKVVVAEVSEGGAPPRIISAATAKSAGLRHGYIMSTKDISASIASAVNKAQRDSGIQIDNAYISFGGVGLDEINATGTTTISRVDKEVAEHHIDEAISNAKREAKDKLTNKKIIHSIPISYTLDNEAVLGNPIGMQGSKLAVNVLFITALEQHLADLITAVENVGIEVLQTTAAPIAASLVTLNKAQKMAGCVLANIGAETTSIAIFEDDMPVSIKVIPLGSSNITNDIAIGLKIPLMEAEQIKLGAVTGTDYSQKKLNDIVTSRLKDIFKLMTSHLKSIGKAGLLPAGVILTGGGSGIFSIEDLAKSILKLPGEIAPLRFGAQTLKDSSWAVAYGLCIQAADNATSKDTFRIGLLNTRRMFKWVKKFLP